MFCRIYYKKTVCYSKNVESSRFVFSIYVLVDYMFLNLTQTILCSWRSETVTNLSMYAFPERHVFFLLKSWNIRFGMQRVNNNLQRRLYHWKRHSFWSVEWQNNKFHLRDMNLFMHRVFNSFIVDIIFNCLMLSLVLVRMWYLRYITSRNSEAVASKYYEKFEILVVHHYED